MSANHPQREQKIRKWIGLLPPGKQFRAGDVAKDLNLTPVEAGNYLKFIDNVEIYGKVYSTGVIWRKVGP